MINAGSSAKKGRPTFGSRTDVGCVREQNEDSLIVAPPLFVVADGMGGHAAGEVASELAVTTIAEYAPTTADAEALGAAVEIANREIINAALSGRGREGMGTTCTAAVLEGNRLIIAQVGDSRAYLLSQGKLSQLTRDHSLMANMIEAGDITPEEARFHPNRSVITRALGNDVNTVPDLYEINVSEGDRLLLCSDGLTSMINDDLVADIMLNTPDPQECASKLVDAAVAVGGMDNITVIVTDVEGQRKIHHKRLARKTRISIAFVLLLLVLCVAGAGWFGYTYLHNSAYLAASPDGYVQVYRGVPGDVLGFTYNELLETTDIPVSSLSASAAKSLGDAMQVGTVDEAWELIQAYRKQLRESQKPAEGEGVASSTADPSPSKAGQGASAPASAAQSTTPSSSPSQASPASPASEGKSPS